MVCGIIDTDSDKKESNTMTVIMGYKTPNKIYIGADNRTSTVEDITISDRANKIVVVNDNVAVAFSGYSGTQKIFESMIKDSKNRQKYRVEDTLFQLKIIYWLYKFLKRRKASKDTFSWGSRFIIAGNNRKGECCMYTMSILHGKLEKPTLTERWMFPPYDADTKACMDIFAVNAINYHSDFIQRTVKEIALLSKVVSPSGDVWTYDIATGKSTMEHFS